MDVLVFTAFETLVFMLTGIAVSCLGFYGWPKREVYVLLVSTAALFALIYFICFICFYNPIVGGG